MSNISRGHVAFTELNGAFHDVQANAGWVDWDISALVPANTMVLILMSPDANQAIGVREKGSAENRYWGSFYPYTSWTKTNASGIIQCYDASAVNKNSYKVFGYLQ